VKLVESEFLEKAKSELEKAEKILMKMESSSADIIQNCISAMMDSINFISSALLNRISTVDEDYLILIDKHEKEIGEIVRLYFYLKNILNKRHSKVERFVIRVDGWKSSFYLKKEDLEEYLEKIRESIRRLEK
jgi:hypothetical protein